MGTDRFSQVFHHDGPFLSVYADVTRTTEDGVHEVETRWKNLRKDALDQGAPEHVVDRVAERVLEPTHAPGENGRFVVATEDAVVLDELVPAAPSTEYAAWSPLPDTVAWLADSDLEASVVVVLADHAGADLVLHDAWPDVEPRTWSVDGETLHLHKVRHPRVSGGHSSPPGGTAGEQPRGDIQSSTEEVWRRNARVMAAEIDRVAPDTTVVALGGEPGVCSAVSDDIGAAAADKLVVLDHGTRAAGGSDAALADAVRAALRDHAVAARLQLVHEARERQGRGEKIATGVRSVLAATAQGQVETLLVDADQAPSGEVRPFEFDGLSLPAAVDTRDAVRADQVAIAAAARTGAAIHVAGTRTLSDDGVAALLRWEM